MSVQSLARLHYKFAMETCGQLIDFAFYLGTVTSMTQPRYRAFVNSRPLQTDTFLFPLIHSHNVILSSNKF